MLGNKTESFAILVHRAIQTGSVEVTSHKVIPAPDSGYALGAGRLFNQQDKTAMLDVLAGTKSSIEFIPKNVLARDGSGHNMVWFTEPHTAKVNFREASYTVPLPILVYAKFENQPLRVFAAKGKKRPETSTKLFVAPLGNININGTMCGGNVSTKPFSGHESMLAYESFAVEARSTHLGDTPPVKGVTTQECYKGFIESLAAEGGSSFPATKLIKVKMKGEASDQLTLADLVKLGEV